eukprot:gnl/MRDRNA2_/MRDRNA2_99794_c0_seq1.p1 gnl/MRDRNA2_/MRDRNA2_99794_c0~~gnl/MRDRNA2_/MRDRNA2_99794_c0_seq1.p1  ORF type:complete len:653 (-),score=155.41 gnl/MRDRNA2_/MRDRNA2_99794_c0_seq1:151-2109(-)
MPFTEDDETRILGDTLKRLEGHMCFIDEWFEEDLPLENKEGDALDHYAQHCVEQYYSPPGLLKTIEEFQKDMPEIPEMEVIEKKKIPAPAKEKVLVFTDLEGYCEAIMEEAKKTLTGRITKSQVVDTDPAELEQADVAKLLKPGWTTIIFGYGLDWPESDSVEDVIDFNTHVSRVFFYLCQEIMKAPDKCKRLAVLTRGVLAHEPYMHQESGLGLITHGTLWGMCNTARLEFASEADIAIQYIDTELYLHLKNHVSIVPRLMSEIFRVGSFGHNTVRIMHSKNTSRYVMRQMLSTKYEMAKKEFKLQDDSIIGISGGNGALGIIFGTWLVDQAEKQKISGLKIQFLSRSMKITKDNEKAWNKLEKKAEKIGVVVEQAKLDMSSQAGTDKYVESCNGKLAGFIHSAGVLRDSMISSQTWEKFEDVFDSKHRAALYLHESLEKVPQKQFDFLWLFSSVAAFGNMGQMNYSGSNSFLDGLARHRCALGKHTVAMRWGPWGEVGMFAGLDKVLKKKFETGFMPPFKTVDGIKGFELGLSTGCHAFTDTLFNPQAMNELMGKCETVNDCYMRNLYSEMVGPTPKLPSLGRAHTMSVIRMCKTFYHWNTSNDWLTWFWTVNKGKFELDEDEYDPEAWKDTNGYKWPVAFDDEDEPIPS